jgi:coenzyme F420-dependent glucose-6-phosphate dehydrogenase
VNALNVKKINEGLKLSRLKISVNIGEGYNDPMQFIECVSVAEKYQFDVVWFGDHLLPWIHSQNKSGFVWSIMPVALDRTRKVKVGVLVTSPIGGRYHPLIIGQASASIDNMYPGRFLLGVGSGEAINESRFFAHWPKWQERIERLVEAVSLIRQMWECDDYFTYEGKYFDVKDFFLYTRPKTRIPIYFAAQGRRAAFYAGVYGDHLVTVNSVETCRDTVFPSFEESARKAGKDLTKMEKMVEVPLYFADKRRGIEEVRKSGEAGFFAEGSFNEIDPRKVQEMSTTVKDEVILANFCFVVSPDDVINVIDRYAKVGATHIELVTHSFPERIRYIGEKVLPYFSKK